MSAHTINLLTLLSLALLPHLFYLLALLLEFLLLLLELPLCLLLLNILVLHRVADQRATEGSHAAADSRTHTRGSDCRAYNCTSCRAESSSQ
jgi:hypothetical protein